jgi:hypothetical protein
MLDGDCTCMHRRREAQGCVRIGLNFSNLIAQLLFFSVGVGHRWCCSALKLRIVFEIKLIMFLILLSNTGLEMIQEV